MEEGVIDCPDKSFDLLLIHEEEGKQIFNQMIGCLFTSYKVSMHQDCDALTGLSGKRIYAPSCSTINFKLEGVAQQSNFMSNTQKVELIKRLEVYEGL